MPDSLGIMISSTTMRGLIDSTRLNRRTLEVLRQPLEDKVVTISRASIG